jgi:hypothetical protein
MMAEGTGRTTCGPASSRYTTRLLKGGALLDEMRQLVRTWNDAPIKEQRESGIRSNILNKQTRKRLADVYQYAFLPRFVAGPIPNAWQLVRPLEDAEAPIQIVRPVYYWVTANAEALIGDFCREVIFPRQASVRGGIGTEDVLRWLDAKACQWSPAAALKVAQGLLAALRDFGILEGRARKRLASLDLPVRSFAYLALCLTLNGTASRALLTHPDWQLFLLAPNDVEHLFLVAHQERLLEYQAAGSVVSISFPTDSPQEYAHVVA